MWSALIFLGFLSACAPKPPIGIKTTIQQDCMTVSGKEEKQNISRNLLLLAPPLKKSPLFPSWFYQKISINISGALPIKEVFLDLAKKYSLSIFFEDPMDRIYPFACHMQEQPLKVILDSLCDMLDLRYALREKVIYLKEDKPYYKTYNIQFLSGNRQTQTQSFIKTDILADGMQSPGSRKQSSHNNGANISVNTQHTANYWEELENVIRNLLQVSTKSQACPYAFNRYAGILSVFATEKQHQQVETYLKKLRDITMSQVLIEAKIIEVDLSKEHRSGINWSLFFKNLLSFSQSPSKIFESHHLGAEMKPLNDAYTFRIEGPQLQLLATFMEKFGQVRTLANPRLTVINNQSALLKVAHNEVFFELQVRDEFTTSHFATQRAQSRIQTVPIGLILYVHPSIHFDTGEITVALHPSLSRVVGTKADPAVSFNQRHGSQMQSQIPIVQVREMDSIIVARENQIIVTGGLMEERMLENRTGIPFLSDLPILGKAFSFKNKECKTTELVILLKLSILKQDHQPSICQESSALELERH